MMMMIHSFIPDIHSFIHYGDLYSAPARLLLRSAPNSCTAEKKSFETRVECVRKNPGKQYLRQRKPIPHRGTNHRECTGLGCGCTSKRKKSNPCSDDRSELQPLVPGVGWQRSRRLAGARPRIHLPTMAPIRNMIRCWRGSQWSTSSM